MYFPENKAKADYISAITSENQLPEEKLRKLLFRRAVEATQRSKTIQDEKPSIISLNNAGALSEDLLKSFNDAEK